PGSPAPAGNAGGVVDVLEARPGRVRRVHRRPEGGRGATLHAPLAARSGRGSLPALRHADDRQSRHPAVLTSRGPDTASERRFVPGRKACCLGATRSPPRALTAVHESEKPIASAARNHAFARASLEPAAPKAMPVILTAGPASISKRLLFLEDF